MEIPEAVLISAVINSMEKAEKVRRHIATLCPCLTPLEDYIETITPEQITLTTFNSKLRPYILEGEGVGGFICESILSCGGQIILPDQYLKEVINMFECPEDCALPMKCKSDLDESEIIFGDSICKMSFPTL